MAWLWVEKSQSELGKELVRPSKAQSTNYFLITEVVISLLFLVFGNPEMDR